MTLFFLILLISLLILLFYYEFTWKKVERNLGKSFIFVAGAFLFGSNVKARSVEARPASREATETNWGDWKYRVLVEFHRREQLNAQSAAILVGVSQDKVERYFDKLEGKGKIQQMGDAKRGIYYKVVSE